MYKFRNLYRTTIGRLSPEMGVSYYASCTGGVTFPKNMIRSLVYTKH